MRSILVFLFTWMLGSTFVEAQDNQYLTTADSDPQAVSLLDKMEKQLQQERISMEFDISITHPAETPLVYTGQLIQQDNMYRIITEGMEIWCNGEVQWIFSKDVNEVNLYSAEQREVPGPLGLILEYTGDKYVAILDGTEQMRSVKVKTVELKPVDRDAEIAKIRLYLQLDGRPMRIEIMEKSAARTVCDILDMRVPEIYPESYFSYNKADYPGVHVEDLRID